MPKGRGGNIFDLTLHIGQRRGIFTSLPDHPRSFTTLPTSKVYNVMSVRSTLLSHIQHIASTCRYF